MKNLDIREDIAAILDEGTASEDEMLQTYGMTQGDVVIAASSPRYINSPMVAEVEPTLDTDIPRHWRMMMRPIGAVGLRVIEFGIAVPGADKSETALGHEIKVNTDIGLAVEQISNVRSLFGGIGGNVLALVAESGDSIFSGIERRFRRVQDDAGNPKILEWSQLIYSKELLKTTDIAREAVIYLRNKKLQIPDFIHFSALEKNREQAAKALALSALAHTVEL